MDGNRRSGGARRAGIAACLGLLATLGAACSDGGPGGDGPSGGGGANGDTGAGSRTGALYPPWTELAMPAVSVQGGSATAPGGVGQPGGEVHLLAQGDITLDSGLTPVPTPDVPAAPGDATKVDADALAADVSVGGSVRLVGKLMSGGSDAVRTITSGGDIFVEGTLRSADLGGARQGLTLTASGTVYVAGAIDSSGAASSGQSGGALTITASRVVVTGKLLSSGGSGSAAGGPAGAITIQVTESMISTGTIESFGGVAEDAGPATGGAAADLAIKAGGDVMLAGAIRIRGGAATSSGGAGATGGAAATLRIDADGAVTLGGTVDARGGLAIAMSGAAAGGAAGGVLVGDKARPTQLSILVPVTATGGDGDMAGGAGGKITPEPGTGNLSVATVIDVSGGSSLSAPGAGGLVTGGPQAEGTGGVFVTGAINASGGSIRKGGVGNGGDAGRVDFEIIPTLGPVTIAASGKITVDGGSSGGAGIAGGGGHVWLFSKDADVTLAGKISARGGNAPDDGGTGGLGGMVYFFTDNNHNALNSTLGNLLVDTTGVIDASGGDGTIGGSARNHPGGWPTFPEQQEEIAIFFNCDGVHGETMNWMENRGHLIARGGVHNGNGGDVVYHGIGPGQRGTPFPPGGNHHPPSGNVDNAADGTGMPGDFAGE
jgi:hypothetical protein